MRGRMSGGVEGVAPKAALLMYAIVHCLLHHRGAILESVCYRIALISALRSKKLGGKTVGLMVTASHNPEEVRERRLKEIC